MEFALIPEPKQLAQSGGLYPLPATVQIGISSRDLYPAALLAGQFLKRTKINIVLENIDDDLSLTTDPNLAEERYLLTVSTNGIRIIGGTAAAVRHGLQTLRQIIEQSAKEIPCLEIDDWPDFAARGIYYDVCRGRVPKLERLKELAEHLSRHKINQLQLYIEHTFAFRGHPAIGKGASPLTAADILDLDEFCSGRGIELVPSLASFGHMANILKLKQYRHLAEDLGIGRFEAPEDERPAWFSHRAWTLSPAVPEVYEFLDSLFAEFLPLFRSGRVNICCDETWDLGMGQSYKLCRKKGRGVVYLKHVKKVRKLCRKYGKKVMFWGDIIRKYPDLIEKIPDDVTVLDWGYSRNHPFSRIKDFGKVGLPFYACPGTSSWVSLFPRLPEAKANIHGFAKAAKKNKATGLLTTDWGDGGHYNFMEYSWPGYLFAAEQAWTVAADRATFTRRFAEAFLKCGDPELVKAIDEIGAVSFVNGPYYQSIWLHAFFAKPGDPVLNHSDPIDLTEVIDGKIATSAKPFDAEFAAPYLQRASAAGAVFAKFAKTPACDPLGVLPYWVFAADTIAFAARKVVILGPGGDDRPASRLALCREMRSLMRRFEKFWLKRNRRSEIRITLKKYEAAIAAL